MASSVVPADARQASLHAYRQSGRSVLAFAFVCLSVLLFGLADDQKLWLVPSVQMAAARQSKPSPNTLGPSSSVEELASRAPAEKEGEEGRPLGRRRTKRSHSTKRRSGPYDWPVEPTKQPEQPQGSKGAGQDEFSTQKEEENLVKSHVVEVAEAAASPAPETGVLHTLRNLFSPQGLSNAEKMKPLATQICEWFVKGRFETPHTTKILFLLAAAHTPKSGVPAQLLRFGRRREAGVSESDAPLSSEGETQAQKMDLMLYSLISQIHECEKEKQRRPTPSFCVEAFISSPLTCSIQTASFATAASGKWFLCKSQRETVKRQTRVPWLLDPILKERTKTSAQVGTEATELQTKLQALRKKGSIASTVLDFSLLHPQHAWWLPSSPEQLLEILKGNAAKERTGSSSSSSGIYPFIVGKAEPWPPSIGAKSLKETSENMQSSLQNKSIPPPNSPLLKESAEALKLRTQVFIRILCAADNFFSGAVVSHPRFLKELLGVGKVKPGDVNGAVLTCAEGKEHLTVLGAQGSRTSYEGAERKSSSSSEISDAEA